MPRKKNVGNFLDNVDTDIVCGCEIWLNPSIGDSEVQPSNSPYSIYWKDRPDGFGGSLLLITNIIISHPIDINTRCDIIFWKIDCTDSQILIIGSAYRPTNSDVKYTQELIEIITSVCLKFKDVVIWIAGDFNLPYSDWQNSTVTRHQYQKPINEAFLTLEGDLGLIQVNDCPTG